MRQPDPQTDELAMAIGYALAAWSAVENAFEYVFEEAGDLEHVRAHVTMAGIPKFVDRVDGCTELISQVLAKRPVEKETCRRLADKCKVAYTLRHQLAHFGFQVSGINGERIVRVAPFWSFGNIHLRKVPTPLSVKDIQNRQTEFEALFHSIIWYRQHLRHLKGFDAEPLPTKLIKTLVNRSRLYLAKKSVGSMFRPGN
ncbi:hypothetical protein QP166_13665 [Sphingomonas sp. LR60]|uniref:hypothetical protein n=1 Tax=Sphingomonas sp. LR60 TaxID=3050233 RepID=UPI002FE3D19D